MPRLIDDLRAGSAQMPWFVAPWLADEWSKHTSRVLSLLRDDDQLPVLLIDNVCDYYFQSDQEYWDLIRDFPNLAPPFQSWWSEHKLPAQIHSKEKGDTNMGHLVPHGRIGVLTVVNDAKEVQGEIPGNARWILWCELFVDYGERGYTAQGTHGSIFLAVDEHGVLVERPWMQSYDGGLHAEVMRNYMTWLYPTLLAVSFLHCKNVTIVDNPVEPKLAKRYRERHHGVTPRPYKTLVIEPLKKILRTKGQSDSVGLAKALHICRGHFADYREGRGLFGKYHQLVWFPQVVRGTKGGTAPPREIEVKV